MKEYKLVKCKSIIDGTGAENTHNALLIKKDRVVKTGDFDTLSKSKEYDAEVIDYSEYYITPGIIDAHTHVIIDPDADFTGFVTRGDSQTKIAHRGMVNLKKTLDGGVTFIRDLGGYKFIDIELKKLVDANLIEGPDLVASGQMITMTGGHGWSLGRECDGVAEVTKAAREQLKAGATVLKIMATGGNLTPGPQGAPQLTSEEIKAAVEVAHKYGVLTTTHSHSAEGVKNALNAGIDCIEHGMFIDDEAIDYMLKHNIPFVPTLVAPWICATQGEARGLSPESVAKTKFAVDKHMQNFKKAVKRGVRIAVGTDAGTPFCEHGKSHIDEMKLMVEGGFTPMQAIVAGTKISAEVVGVEKDHGTLENGKKANFLVLSQNPLEDLNAFAKLSEVYKNGERVIRKHI